ncbi:VanZ family protein [Thermodesulfobacteriota bacterium]
MTGKEHPDIFKSEEVLFNKVLRFQRVWCSVAFMNIGLIIILSLIPGPEDIPRIFGLDKVLHIIAYAFSMLWCNMCYRDKKYIILFSVGLILMGIALEIVQGVIGYRMMSIYDMIANSIGVLFGLVLARTRLSLLLSYVEKRFIIS